MKVVKKINNNVAVCVDGENHELVAFGKGIGFPQIPYELMDLSKIKRTFYGINPIYMGSINEIPEAIFNLSAKIVDYARLRIAYEINMNIVFTLADHINFMIQRYKKNMDLKMPFSNDIQHLYEIEFEVGKYAIELINTELNIYLTKDEVNSIALHFINMEMMLNNSKGQIDEDKIINELTVIIENDLSIKIKRESFNYSRFVSHLQYLLKRSEKDTKIMSENEKLYKGMIKEFPEIYDCILDIKRYLESNMQWDFSDEEQLYLMLHINRLCSREDCYQ